MHIGGSLLKSTGRSCNSQPVPLTCFHTKPCTQLTSSVAHRRRTGGRASIASGQASSLPYPLRIRWKGGVGLPVGTPFLTRLGVFCGRVPQGQGLAWPREGRLGGVGLGQGLIQEQAPRSGRPSLPDHKRRSRSSAVMHVTPELEVLGSNPDGVKGRNAVS